MTARSPLYSGAPPHILPDTFFRRNVAGNSACVSEPQTASSGRHRPPDRDIVPDRRLPASRPAPRHCLQHRRAGCLPIRYLPQVFPDTQPGRLPHVRSRYRNQAQF